jgi:FlaA1/EpsC-like NDP-sugar epimerase
MLLKYRRILILGFHVILIAFSNYLAFWIRFEGIIPRREVDIFVEMVPWLIVIRGLNFLPLRLYQGMWRYTGIWDLRNVIFGVGLSSVLFFILVRGIFGIADYPLSVFVLDALLLIFMMGGSRLAWRLYHGTRRGSGTQVLIYGAGDAGEMLVREMKNNGGRYNYQPIGFLDDNRAKVGQRIHGVPVLGTGEQIQEILRERRPDEVLLAIPSAGPSLIRRVLTALEPYKIPIRTLPTAVKNSRTVAIRQIQDLSTEDLLERLPVDLNLGPVEELVRGKTILITGAGGSIGSELCRQLAQYKPARLVLLDQSESPLYDIEMELQRSRPEINRVAVLADIKNARVLKQVFGRERPEIVFHAAAYKHVPMMEDHPNEAVLNNVVGAYRLMELAAHEKVQRFVLISTDKAVNPTNVMGATKRINEMCIQAMAHKMPAASTIFSAVRFGNVLGSNGSVVPLFLKQIEQGGPVTVTHPEVMRYFMTIPEAVVLVLQAATQARGGEIFVLEMGEQIKLMEMARHLIRMAGYIPETDIPITLVGLRPGEKLREELVAMDEALIPSPMENIRRVQSGWIADMKVLHQNIERLEHLATQGQSRAVLELLLHLVPTFRPVTMTGAEVDRASKSKKNALSKLHIFDQSA